MLSSFASWILPFFDTSDLALLWVITNIDGKYRMTVVHVTITSTHWDAIFTRFNNGLQKK